MFTNGRHHSSTHVALAIAQQTRKIREAQREQRKWNVSAGDCRSMPRLQTMLSTQTFLYYCTLCTLKAKHTHTHFAFFYTVLSNICREEITPFSVRCFEMEIDQKAARVVLNFYFTEKKRHSKYKDRTCK